MTIAIHEVPSLLADMEVVARRRLAKAAAPATRRRQQQLLDEAAPEMAKALADYFEAFADRALPVRKAVAIKWDPDDIDWEVEERELGELFATWYARLGVATYEIVGEQLGAEVSWSLNSRGARRVLSSIGDRVKDITDTTRDALQRTVGDAIDRGLSIDDLVRGAEGFVGLRDLVAGWTQARAETIARTETATAYSLASVGAYRDSGLIDEVEVLDGPDCGWTDHDDPDLADGKLVSLDDAEEYPVSHPNCQRAFAPVPVR